MEEIAEKALMREVLNERNISSLATRISRSYPSFPSEEFVAQIMKQLPPLSIGDRTRLIKDQLYQFLPKDFPESAKILVESLMPGLEPESISTTDNFIIWPLTMYVSEHGQEYFDISMNALYEMTKRFTAEFGIRTLLDKYPEASWRYLEKWAKDANPHARRLVSEGTRPRLPWAARLHTFGKGESTILPLLKYLANDPTELVRRSVANHLNDIAKENPALVISTLSDWQKDLPDLSHKLVKHALRTLIKKGDKGALALLGVKHGSAPLVKTFRVKKKNVQLGGYLEVETELVFENDQVGQHVIDYVVYFLKANGQHNPKVFKWKNIQLSEAGQLSLQKRHLLKHFTTRTHYVGTHYIAIQINGEELAKLEFELEE